MTATLAPGCNLPCLSPNPDLWWYDVEAKADGNLSSMSHGDPERVTDRYSHLVVFPTWSQGTLFFCQVPEGQSVKVIATSESDLQVTFADGSTVEISEEILVLYHDSLDFDTVRNYYSQ